jgi:hypothetical protein
MQTIFEFPSGALVTFTMLEASSGKFSPHGMLEFRGNKGTLYTGGANDYKIVPTSRGQFQTWDKLMDGEDYTAPAAGEGKLADGSYANPGANLVRNFLDCVKSRKHPWSHWKTGIFQQIWPIWQQSPCRLNKDWTGMLIKKSLPTQKRPTDCCIMSIAAPGNYDLPYRDNELTDILSLRVNARPYGYPFRS